MKVPLQERSEPLPESLPDSPTSLAERALAVATRPQVAVIGSVLILVAHALLVAPRYHVGSFDDDAAYLVMAKAIAGGTGLAGHMPSGPALVSAYPPGLPYLLAPLILVFGGHDFEAERLFSLVCMAAVLPLTWAYLRERRISPGVRLAVLLLLAINPLVGTYANMVMAEAPFMVAVLVALLAGERWVRSQRLLPWSGVVTILSLAGATWIKEEALALLPAAALFLLWKRQWWRAVFVTVGGAALLSPILIARILTHTPIAGARYASEISGYYSGGIVERLLVAIPVGIGKLIFDAIPSAIVPTDAPLADYKPLFAIFRTPAVIFVVGCLIVGLVWWVRRFRGDLALFLVGGYLAEVLFYDYVNMRRVIILAPIVAAWVLAGAAICWRWAWNKCATIDRGQLWRRCMVAFVAVGVIGPLLTQVQSDYLYPGGSSNPGGSPYMTFLTKVRPDNAVVENSYIWATTLYTGHPAATNAYVQTADVCSDSVVKRALSADHAGYVLIAAIDNPGAIDSECIYDTLSRSASAVPLMYTKDNLATVFELVGPGTPNPDLENLLASSGSPAPADGGQPGAPASAAAAPGSAGAGQSTGTNTSTMQWSLKPGTQVTQVSLGSAEKPYGATSRVEVQLLEGDTWQTITSAAGAVGDDGVLPLLAQIPPVAASAVRVEVSGSSPDPAEVEDLGVIGKPAG